MITIEPPSLLGGNVNDQLQQLQSYLYRTSQQLQWAFDTLETGGAAAPAQTGPGQSFSSKAVFAGIKDLILKSAEIVDSYSAQIGSRLEKRYAAQSEFGTFRERTTQTLENEGKKLDQLLTQHQELTGTVDGLYDQARSTEAYLKTGLLGRNPEGNPIYGLEIGQSNQVDGQTVFDKFARFTPNRLSFFDASDVEVAYVSDYQLYITNARITGSLTLGNRFKVFTGRGLVFQWTGGNENG